MIPRTYQASRPPCTARPPGPSRSLPDPHPAAAHRQTRPHRIPRPPVRPPAEPLQNDGHRYPAGQGSAADGASSAPWPSPHISRPRTTESAHRIPPRSVWPAPSCDRDRPAHRPTSPCSPAASAPPARRCAPQCSLPAPHKSYTAEYSGPCPWEPPGRIPCSTSAPAPNPPS